MASLRRVTPAYILLFKYDIRIGMHENYFRYVAREFVPALESHDLYLYRAWRVVYGNYPERHIEFVAEKREAVLSLCTSTEWEQMESRLKSYTHNYSFKVLSFSGAFRV